MYHRLLYHHARKSPGPPTRAVLSSILADTFALAAADHGFAKGRIDRDFRLRRIVSQAHDGLLVQKWDYARRPRELHFTHGTAP